MMHPRAILYLFVSLALLSCSESTPGRDAGAADLSSTGDAPQPGDVLTDRPVATADRPVASPDTNLDPTVGIHVALDGSDSGDGSQAQPFRTIQKAADVAGPGDAVFIHGGTYQELVRIKNSGEPGRLITFTGYLDEEVIISGAGKTTWDGIVGLFGTDHIRLQRLKVRHNDDGFGILIRHGESDVNDAASFIELANIEVSLVGDTGIQVRGNSHDIMVEDCYTHDLGFSGVDISMWQGGIHPHHVVVRGLTAHDCDFAGIGSEIADDLLIENNEVHDCESMGIDIGSGTRNVITHNTIDKVDTGIGLSSNVDSEVSYNTVSNIGAEALYAYYWSHNQLPHARNVWHHNEVTNALRALYESCQKSDKYDCGDSRDHEYHDNTFVDVGFDWGDPVFYFEEVYGVKFHDNSIKKKTPSFEALNISDGDSYGSSVYGNTIN